MHIPGFDSESRKKNGIKETVGITISVNMGCTWDNDNVLILNFLNVIITSWLYKIMSLFLENKCWNI